MILRMHEDLYDITLYHFNIKMELSSLNHTMCRFWNAIVALCISPYSNLICYFFFFVIYNFLFVCFVR